MPIYEGMTEMELENKLIADLADFNQKYADYVRCNNKKINPNNSKFKCTPSQISINNVSAAHDIVMGDFEALNSADNISNITAAQYKATYSDIMNTHQNKIIPLRADLDRKLQELYKLEGSNTREDTLKYDAVFYSGILWTVAATSLLFYVVTKNT